MISHYKTVSIVYGGNARIYAEKLNGVAFLTADDTAMLKRT